MNQDNEILLREIYQMGVSHDNLVDWFRDVSQNTMTEEEVYVWMFFLENNLLENRQLFKIILEIIRAGHILRQMKTNN
jgi:hypothetical protein